MKKKQIVGIILAVLILVVSQVMSAPAGLSEAGFKTIGLAFAFLVMLITEALNLVITCFIFLGLMYVLGVTPTFTAALSGFTNQINFFVLASFGIAAAFTRIPLSKRILRFLLKVFGKNVKSMLFAMMLCSAIVSSIVSNVPTCAIFMAIALSFLELYKDDAAKRRTAKALMIGVPVASMIGGIITPAGSSINLLAINLLQESTGKTISFVNWMVVGLPVAAVLLPIAWYLCVKVYKPVEINKDMVREFIDGLDVPEKMGPKEIKAVTITLVMLVLWILSSWVPVLNVSVIALLGCCIMFLPGIKILDFKTFITEDVSWESFFLIASVLCIGNAMVTNGVSDWIISLMPLQSAMSPTLLVGLGALIAFVVLIIIPVAPALVTMLATPFIALGAGWSPAAIMLTLAFCAGNCYLLPLDTVTLLTYGTGYYSMTDMPKSTALLQVIMIILMAVWMPIICPALGIM